MGKNMVNANSKKDIREKAEKMLKASEYPLSKQFSEIDLQKLLHELQVHQIELEMQNDELKEANLEIESLLEKYTELYNFAPIGYFTLDEKGKILEVNLSGCNMFNTDRSKLKEMFFWEFLDYKSRIIFDKFLADVFRYDDKQICELSIKDNKNGMKYIQLEGASSNNSNMMPKLCRCVLIDISDRKKVEELKLTVMKTESDDLHLFKSRFLASQSIDIKKSLNLIEVFLNEMAKPNVRLKDRNNYLLNAQHNLSMINVIFSDLLELSQIDAHSMKLNITNGNIDGMFNEIQKIYQNNIIQANKDNITIQIKNYLKRDENEISTDFPKLKQITSNLLDYFLKFVKGGFIYYGCTIKDEATLEFYVSTSGKYIPKIKQSVLTDYLKQARESISEETAKIEIILPITKGLVELMGGRIWLESAGKNITSFYFTIPYNPVSR